MSRDDLTQRSRPKRRRPSDDEPAASGNASPGEIAERTIGPYRLEQRLGAGGMGEVYRAFDQRLGRRVALKQIRPDSLLSPRVRDRFRREARSAARLNHPNIVKVHDILTTRDGDWIVMEWVDGQTLTHHLKAGPLAPERALPLAIEIARALSAAHAEGIVHRDIKSNNVVVTPSGHAKVLDFGLAKQILSQNEESMSLTADGQLLGTPQAMSPEQVRGHKVDLRSDLFSLGSLLYEMVTAVAPFRGANPLQTLKKICTHNPPPVRELVPQIPQGLSDLIDRLLKKDPPHRPQTAVEVVLALEGLEEAQAPETPHDPAPAPGNYAPTLFAEEPVSQQAVRTRSVDERRQVTVVCCELVDKSAPSGSLDPESVYAVMADFESSARNLVERFAGHIANVLGHQLVVYFGYPQAHEDDAWRAVNVALELVSSLQGPSASPLTQRMESARLGVRVGIHTGPAVVLGSVTQKEQVALGQTLDLATRLRKLAEPNQVLVSGATSRLIEGAFSQVAVAPNPVDAVLEAVEVHRILAAQPAQSQWQMAAKIAPLVGRDGDLELLLARWKLAREGHGQVVLLSGEPGIGKSRLVHTLHERVESEDLNWLMAYGSSYAENSPFRPIIDLLRTFFELGKEETPEAQLTRLQQGLARYHFEDQRLVPLVASLLALPIEGRYPPLNLSPQQHREKTLDALPALFRQMSQHRPMVLVVEDLHWVDPSTLELIDRLIRDCVSSSLLLLLTFRLQFRTSWESRNHLTQLHLSRLPGRQTAALIQELTAGHSLPPEIQEHILKKTDGVPLFVEELTKTVLESDILIRRDGRYELTGPLENLSIPATLRDSLAARLDRLGNAKEVAQLAAVIGREFSYELLAAIAEQDTRDLDRELSSLVEADLVQRKGFSSRRRYLFRHALIQDSAYESLLKTQRRGLHQQIASILEDRFPDVVENRPELLAHQYEGAELYRQAIHYLHLAGQHATTLWALVEAMRHFRRGIELVPKLPDPTARARVELELQISLSDPLMITDGYAATSVEETYNRAWELCKLAGEPMQELSVIYRIWILHFNRAEGDTTFEFANRLLKLAARSKDSIADEAANFAMGHTALFMGDPAGARQYLARSAAQFDLERHKSAREIPLLVAPFEATLDEIWAAVLCGYTTQGWAKYQEATRYAALLEDTFAQVRVLTYHGAVGLDLGIDPEALLVTSQKSLALCEKHGFSMWFTLEKIHYGLALLQTGGEGGMEEVQVGLTQLRAIDSKILIPIYLARIAKTFLESQRVDESRSLIEELVQLSQNHLNRTFEAEAYRLQGELVVLGTGDLDGAEAWLRKALDVARRQGTKLLELRAASSLSRALQRQGRAAEGRQCLNGTYQWFVAAAASQEEHRQALALSRDLRHAEASLGAED